MPITADLGALLAACAREDRAAFRRLYDATAPRLYALCRQMLRRDELAEEVLQEAFVQIWRDAARYDPARAAPLTWMAVIVRHRALDVLRKREPLALDEAAHAERATPDPDPLELTALDADRRALRLCLDGLSPAQRDSILLAFLRGLSHQEVSAALAAPLGSVKSWIRRGLEQLRRCLSHGLP